jgi:hypothetical protein
MAFWVLLWAFFPLNPMGYRKSPLPDHYEMEKKWSKRWRRCLFAY